ncbi:MAG: RNA 2',3'-cyclic phosphodiesterase [Brevinematia bacterium]
MDRLFVAIDVPEEIKIKFSEISEKLSSLNAKVVPMENIHITLKFIGETTKTKEILGILDKITFKKFQICLKNVGVFPNTHAPRVFWVGIEKNQEMESLFKIIERSLENIEIPKEKREFSPHITLARFKTITNIQKLKEILKAYNKDFGEFDVKEFILYKSELAHPNPRYYPIKSFKLI